MQDLSGPKIRLGRLDGEITLEPDMEIALSSRSDLVGTRERLPTTYPRLAEDVKPGERVLLADGLLDLEVFSVDRTDLKCRVRVGGVISSNKGLNLPDSALTVPSLTEKDLADLEFGLRLGVDYVALSFVRTPQDVGVLREHMERLGRPTPVIAKIEKPQAVERLEAIIDASDGIMVARGDLGVELATERVPTVQRNAIRLARDRAKLTVVATQMLMSMTRNPRPTHAEVSDVANAVFDGTDAVMLSEETARGAYPVKAVETMAALVHAAEDAPEAFEEPRFVKALRAQHAFAISRAAVVMAHEMSAAAIISFTHRGLGPRLIASWRPKCEIFGCATKDEEVRLMALYWGVRPLKVDQPHNNEALVAAVERATVEQDILPTGATVVITCKMPYAESQPTNMLKLHTIARTP